MARIVEYEILDDTKPLAQPSVADTPREFKAKYEDNGDGTKQLVIQTQSETIVHPDGRRDVIIHAPSLDMVNKFHENHNK